MKEQAKTEKEMREVKDPWPKELEELNEYIKSLVEREHDYGTCCYTMSLAAAATFNYMASQLGVSGFQASCADLDFLRRTRLMRGPFIILKLEDALYPQYDLSGELEEFLHSEDNQKWLHDEAAKLLDHAQGGHPNVISHWKRLANGNS